MQNYDKNSVQATETTKVFIGIDVHLRQWNVCVYVNGRLMKPFQQAPSAATLRAHLDRWYPGCAYYSAYEAGFCGFGPHFDLLELGIQNVVVNAADIGTKDKERARKRDSVDSAKIARELACGNLTPVFTPDLEQIGNRSLIRLRYQVVDMIVRQKIQIRHFLHYHHIEIPQEFLRSKWSKAMRAWVRSCCTDSRLGEGGFCLEEMINHLETILKLESSVSRKILLLMKTSKYAKNFELLRSVPGVGPKTASALLLELGDMSTFHHVDHLCSYLGLVPDARASDNRDTGSKLTRRCHHQLRKCIIECAQRAVGTDLAMSSLHVKYCKSMPHNKSIIKIANKLVKCIKFVLKNQKKYEAIKAR